MRGTVGQQDPLRGCRDIELGEPARDQLAQRAVPELGAEARHMIAGLIGRQAQIAPDPGFLQPAVREAAAAVFGEPILGAQLGQQVRDVDRPIQAAGALHAGARDRLGGDVEAGAPPRFQLTVRHQPIIGLDHREAAYPQARRQLTDRRDARAGAEQPRRDLLADAAHQLLHQRHAGLGVEGEIQDGLPHWPGSWAMTV